LVKIQFLCNKMSAEAKLVGQYEPRRKNAEDSQNDAGLKIKMFQIRHGCNASLAISETFQKKEKYKVY
jgi:hypothetical protein